MQSGKTQTSSKKEDFVEFNLDRFKKAQSSDYSVALQEIKSGKKLSHWMWYIFPQLKGLGFSEMANYYGIAGKAEAVAYLADDVLKNRLVEISTTLLSLKSSDATKILGCPDDLKLKSCMTQFSAVAAEMDIFEKVLEKFFDGEKDEKTLKLLGKKEN